jgi:hypothetical protein
MRLSAAAKLHPLDWLAILPGLASLVGTVVVALIDGRIDDEERKRIGDELIELVGSVTGGGRKGKG